MILEKVEKYEEAFKILSDESEGKHSGLEVRLA